MDKSILAVDSLAVQRSLTLLEDRYRALREIGQKRFEDWETEITELKQQLAEQSAQVAEAKQARDQHADRVTALETEKVDAGKAAEELKQQLAVQSAQTVEAKQARDQQVERVKALEAELAQQTGNLAAMAEALQRLRQLAMRPTS
jgi:chromosome segregation ATPase